MSIEQISNLAEWFYQIMNPLGKIADRDLKAFVQQHTHMTDAEFEAVILYMESYGVITRSGSMLLVVK